MAATARERTAAQSNVAVLRTSGRDLSALRDASFDLVLAVDSFPYLVAGGAELAAGHVAEAHRVLRPRGVLLILNFSYRGDLARDRLDVARLAAHNGFAPATCGVEAFRLWDAVLFQLHRMRE
jgi:SAM-dependent methyltransferase